MERCVICKGKLTDHKEKKDGVEIHGWKCTKCNETYFSSNELLKWEVLSGRRKDNVRKIRKVGNSFTVTFPNIFIKKIRSISEEMTTEFEKIRNSKNFEKISIKHYYVLFLC